MDISIIIASFNRADTLKTSLTHLLNSEVAPSVRWEAVVVDNNSTDETPAIIRALVDLGPVPIHYVFERRQGKSFALNTGVRKATGGVVAFTDDDCIVAPDWIAAIWREYASDSELVGLGGRVILYNQKDRRVSVRESMCRTAIATAAFDAAVSPIIGCNMAFRRWVFEEIGYFDTALGPSGEAAEDLDFVYRLCRRGFKVIYSPEVLVYHNHGRQTDSEVQSLYRTYARGRGAFYCKHVLSCDPVVLRMAYSDVAGVSKRIILKLMAGQTAKREAALLKDLATGAVRRLIRARRTS